MHRCAFVVLWQKLQTDPVRGFLILPGKQDMWIQMDGVKSCYIMGMGKKGDGVIFQRIFPNGNLYDGGIIQIGTGGINAVLRIGKNQHGRAGLLRIGSASDGVKIAAGNGIPDLQIIVPVGAADSPIRELLDGNRNDLKHSIEVRQKDIVTTRWNYQTCIHISASLRKYFVSILYNNMQELPRDKV